MLNILHPCWCIMGCFTSLNLFVMQKMNIRTVLAVINHAYFSISHTLHSLMEQCLFIELVHLQPREEIEPLQEERNRRFCVVCRFLNSPSEEYFKDTEFYDWVYLQLSEILCDLTDLLINEHWDYLLKNKFQVWTVLQ